MIRNLKYFPRLAWIKWDRTSDRGHQRSVSRISHGASLQHFQTQPHSIIVIFPQKDFAWKLIHKSTYFPQWLLYTSSQLNNLDLDEDEDDVVFPMMGLSTPLPNCNGTRKEIFISLWFLKNWFLKYHSCVSFVSLKALRVFTYIQCIKKMTKKGVAHTCKKELAVSTTNLKN